MAYAKVVVLAGVVACGGGHSSPSDAPTQDGSATAKINLEILHTSDLHANLFDWDYSTAASDPTRGFVRIASLVRAERAANPCTLLVDTGDTLQGTALGYYYARQATTVPHPMAAAMNALGYDAMTIGNHELNFGMDVLQRFVSEASFPVLGANFVANDGTHPFAASTIKEVCGVKVAILGVVTRGNASWAPSVAAGYHADAFVATLTPLVEQVRAAGAQVVVVAMHEGPDAGMAVANMVPNVDVVLGGHTHEEVPELMVNNVVFEEPGYWGSDLGKVSLALESSGAGYTITSKHSELLPSTSAIPDPQISAMFQAAQQAVETYLDTPLTTAAAPLAGGDAARFSDNGLADFMSAALLDAASAAGVPADLAFVSIPYDRDLAAGTIRMRDVYATYGFDNGIGVVTLTGADVRADLERAAQWFIQIDPNHLPATAGATHVGAAFSYDIGTGLEYTLDLSQPVGSRVTSLKFHGVDVTDAQTFSVVTSSYRIFDGDHYPGYATAPVLGWSDKLVVEAMADKLAAGPFDPAPTHVCNFALTPDLYGAYYGSGAICP